MRFNWIRRWLSSKKSPKNQLRQDTKARLGVQELENRLVPATLIVNTLADTIANDGQLSLREAVDAVNLQGNGTLDAGALAQITGAYGTSDTILFNAPLAGGIITLGGTELPLEKSMSIDGENVRPAISGNGTSRIFNIDNLAPGAINVNIANLTLANGNATAGGNGGAIFNVENLNLSRVTVQSNRADAAGGGLFTSSGVVVISASTFVANTAAGTGGGAVAAAGGTVSILNSTITGNHGNTVGGGVLSESTTTTITNTTVVENFADTPGGTGGGIQVVSGTVTLRNTIVAGNADSGNAFGAPADLNGTFSAASANNLIGDPATAENLVEGVNGNRIGDGANNALPSSFIVLPLSDNGGPTLTHAITATPNRARDGGNNTLATNAGLTSDQRGVPFARIANTTVDIGAYEEQTLNLVVDNLFDDDDGFYNVNNLTLREAINLANANPGADTITFSSVNLNNSTIGIGADLVIREALTINGLGADRLTLNGFGAARIFFVGDGLAGEYDVSISNLTLNGGFNATEGGALVNTENLSLAFVEITNSTAPQGGGISNYGNLSITHSTLANNNASTGDGGAILNSAGELTIRNSTISDNRATGYGSAIENTGNVSLLSSTVVNNRARALDTGNGNGALDNFGLNFLLQNSIIAGNVRGTAAPTPSDACGTFTGQSNLIGDANSSGGLTHGVSGNIVGNAGNGTLDVNTILDTDLELNGGPTRTHALVVGGAAFNAGNTTLATNANLTTDQRGGIYQRVIGAAVDIGAYEAQIFTLVVNNNGDTDDGNYTTGNFTLREAINIANANPGTDTITFNTSLNNQTITLAAELPITDDVNINGLGADRLTISGNGTSRVFNVEDGVAGISLNATISNLTLTSGFNATSGGALLNRENLILAFVEVTNSCAGLGGGILNNGSLSISHSTFVGNNATTTDGGAIFNAGNLTLADSTLSGNFGNFGSAFSNQFGNATVISSTVVNNRARGFGAVDNFEGNLTLQNTIVAGNLRNSGNSTVPSDLNNFNAALPITGQFNLIGNATSSAGFTHGVNGNIVGVSGNGTLDVNLILNTTLTNNGGRTRTHALVNGSPALNAGNTTLATNANLTTDQRGAGFPRVVGTVDIGAFEVQDATPPTVVSVTSLETNGTFGLGDFLLIQVNFSENVTVTGTPQLTLETGAADAVIDYLSGNGTSMLLFEYLVGTGHASADLDHISTSALALNNGTIQDGAGNNANLTLPAPAANGSLGANKNLVIDGVVPTVTSFDDNDADNVISVNVTQNYTVQMSADINNATVSAADFDNAGNATISIGNVTYLGNGTFRVPVTPTSTGTVILRAHANATIEDLAGNPLTVPVQDNDTVTVATNQAPINVVPGTQTVLPGQFLLLSAANGNSLSFNDDSANVSVNLQATAGGFTFAINYGVGVTGYNSANMTINGPLANVQKTLDTLFYIAPEAPASATVTITSNDSALQDQDTFTINTVATKANVAPTIKPLASQNFTANTALALGNSSIQFGDIDAGVNPVVVNLKVNNGTLSIASAVGLSFTGQGSNNLTLTGRIDHLNYNLQQAFTYTPNTGFTGNDVLQITINDQGNTGTGGPLTAAQNVALTGPGGAPDTTPPTLTSFEDNDADNVVSINSVINYTVTFNEAMNGTSITAADFNNNGTANISIGNVTQTGVGVYNVPVTPTSLGTITLRIPTGAVVQDVAGNNLTVPVQDNDTLTVTTNQAPVNAVPANQTVIAGSTNLFSIANGNSLNVDDDSTNVAVNVMTNNGLLTFAVNYGVSVTGYNSANMTVNGTLANVKKTLDTLFYIAPVTPGAANITITSTDGALQDQDTFALTIVNPADKVNVAPTIATQAANLSFSANTPLAFNLANNTIHVGDIDAGTNFVSVNLKVNTGVLGFVNNSGLNVQGAGTGNLTLTGRIDHLNFSLPSLTYTAAGSANDTLQININDLGNTGTGGAKTAAQNVSLIGNGTVVVQNQAPVNTAPTTATVLPNTYYLFSRGNLNAIQVADADLGAGNITVNLGSNAGLFAFAINYGVTVTGYGSNNLAISGPLANVNNTLDTMFFIGGNGATVDGQAPVIVVTSNDNGNTGPGGARTDVDTIALTFEAANVHVNVAPTILSPVDTQIGGTINFNFANNNAIQIGDKDAGVANVQVTLQVPNGTLDVVNTPIQGTTVAGRGTGTLILTGPVNLLNYYLQTLAYTMNALPNTDTLSIFITDLANTGTGGQKTANAAVAISRV